MEGARRAGAGGGDWRGGEAWLGGRSDSALEMERRV